LVAFKAAFFFLLTLQEAFVIIGSVFLGDTECELGRGAAKGCVELCRRGLVLSLTSVREPFGGVVLVVDLGAAQLQVIVA